VTTDQELRFLREAKADLYACLKAVVAWADTVGDYWDADQDSKVGKHLAAMSGRLKGYTPTATCVHALLDRYAVKEKGV